MYSTQRMESVSLWRVTSNKIETEYTRLVHHARTKLTVTISSISASVVNGSVSICTRACSTNSARCSSWCSTPVGAVIFSTAVLLSSIEWLCSSRRSFSAAIMLDRLYIGTTSMISRTGSSSQCPSALHCSEDWPLLTAVMADVGVGTCVPESATIDTGWFVSTTGLLPLFLPRLTVTKSIPNVETRWKLNVRIEGG